MNTLHPGDLLESLERTECLQLLRSQEIGRFAFILDGQPRIAPVNYRLIDGDVVLTSRPGAKLDAAVHHQLVAFEIDQMEQWAEAGWSVVVQGVATVVSDARDLAGLMARSPQPWAPASHQSVIRIVSSDVSGRRVRIKPGGVTVLHQV